MRRKAFLYSVLFVIAASVISFNSNGQCVAPTQPNIPTYTTNTCGPRTLSKSGTPASGISWYWQGTNSAGTDFTSATATATTYSATLHGNNVYWIRARNNSTGCWSASTGVPVAVNNPPPPSVSASSYQGCEWETIMMSAVNVYSSVNWYNSSGSLVGTGSNYYAENLDAGTHTYTVKSVSSGCVGSAANSVALTITANCDAYLNWTQVDLYNTNEVGSTTMVASSRDYTDAFGSELQSQSKLMTENTVMATQPIYDARGVASIQTLPAPINSATFVYRSKFVTDGYDRIYGADDFDRRVVNGSTGEVNNPSRVYNNGLGSLGWYYSSANTLEPKTPVTGFPYARSFMAEGANPTTIESAIAGDQFRKGAGHESSATRETFMASEISHYFQIKTFFSNDQNTQNVPFLSNGDIISPFSANQSVTITQVDINGQDYVRIATQKTSSTPGTWPIGGNFTVVPGHVYKFRLKGYRQTPNVYLYVKNVSANSDLVWPGALLPSGAANEAWIETQFTIPSGCTSISIGALFSGLTASDFGQAFYINEIQLINTSTSDYLAGYKITTTDPNEKQAAAYMDSDGKTLATATFDGTNYDNWSYAFYDDASQAKAVVAPKGVNLSSTAYPSYVTLYKYDHLGRVIETSSPDEGRTQFAYDFDGRVRFSQNNEQRSASTKRFSYTNYDFLGRPVEFGEYSCSGTNPYIFETHDITSPASNSVLNIIENKIDRIDEVTSSNYVGISEKLDAARCGEHTFIGYDFQSADFISDGVHTAQTYLTNQLAKTETTIAKTWYSYDEFGSLVWSMQNITGLGTKTIDYKYDFLGNVTEVGYQKSKTDAFYHHYLYDVDQRLIEVQTSKDGASKTSRAKYDYYLHGPLKRTELWNGTTGVQGIDYVYMIDGSVKTINNAEPSRDPGLDGISGANASFGKDVFGSTFYYHDNDYVGASYDPGQQSFASYSNSGFSNQYNGIPKALSWNNFVDRNVPRTLAFSYDGKYQLLDSKFGNLSAGSFVPSTSDFFRESLTGYDKNGNINGLTRKDKCGSTLANYSYVYESNSNKLDKINNGGTLLIDYTYNSIGQLTRQSEGSSTFNFIYNFHGFVKEIRNASSQLVVEYTYDDRGSVIKSIDYNAGAAIKATYYLRDAAGNTLATYEQLLPSGTPQLVEQPIYGFGRVGLYKPTINTYFYEVNDHLGNVRAVIGLPDTQLHTATMETENAGNEQPPFSNVNERRVTCIPANDPTTGGNEAVRMNNTRPDGPAIELSVSPGDKIDIEAYAYYESGTAYGSVIDQATMITAIANAFGGVPGGPGEAGQIYNRVNAGIGRVGLGSGGSSTLPAAYLQYMVYDINYTPLFGGYQRVTSSGNLAREKIVQPQITINEPGYILIFLYNRSNSTNWVYFDDLKVTHEYSAVVAGGDYYPFGLEMASRQVSDETYRYGYQGQFSGKDETTGLNNFELRNYEPRIGRWLSSDPYGQFHSPYVGMGNMPHLAVDPDGGYVSMFSWQGALIGAAVGAGVGLLADKDNWALYAVGGAAAGGFFASDFAKVEIWGTHRGLGNANALYGGGRENIARLNSMNLKYQGNFVNNAFTPIDVRTPVSELKMNLGPLPSIVGKIKPRIPRITRKQITATIRSSGYSDQGLDEGRDANKVAGDLHSIYQSQTGAGFRNVTIVFTSTKPTLSVRNYARKIFKRLRALGVPQKAIIEEVVPVQNYGNPKYQEDQLHSNVTGTYERVKN